MGQNFNTREIPPHLTLKMTFPQVVLAITTDNKPF